MAELGFRTRERNGRPRGLPGAAQGHHALEGEGNRSFRGSLQSADAEPRGPPQHASRRITASKKRSTASSSKWRTRRSKIARPLSLSMPIRNVHRTVGTMLSGEIARRYGSAGLPDDTIRVQFTGCAGQSFGAFLAKGVTLTLEGDGERLRRQGTFRRQADHLSRPRNRNSCRKKIF